MRSKLVRVAAAIGSILSGAILGGMVLGGAAMGLAVEAFITRIFR